MCMGSPNLLLLENFVKQPDQLFRYLRDTVEWDERLRTRKTASFGVSYGYSGMTYPQTRMPDELSALCDKIKKQIGFRPNNCLMNFYLDGNSSMGYHSDSAQELAPDTGVVIISLGAVRHIYYKSKVDPSIIHKYKLSQGMLLHMGNDVQHQWLHAIPKESGIGERISLTFRHIVNV